MKPQSAHPSKIDHELSSLSAPQRTHIAELHSILDDGAGHINSDLARSIWQWENTHFHSSKEDPYPAKRLQYSTRDGLRLVDDIARKMDDGRRHADLVQEGVVALMRCTVLWDEQNSAPEQDAKAEASFESFARMNIEKAMKRVLTESREFVGDRVEINLDLLKKRGVEQAKRMENEGAFLVAEELSNQIVQPLREALQDANPTPVEIALADMIRHDIGEFLERQLTDQELKIVKLRFGLGQNIGSSLSTEQIGGMLELDVFSVLELEQDALKKLRVSFEDDYIGAYLDDDYTAEVSL